MSPKIKWVTLAVLSDLLVSVVCYGIFALINPIINPHLITWIPVVAAQPLLFIYYRRLVKDRLWEEEMMKS